MQLEVVRDVGGRPLFLTARRFIKICRRIEQGESISEACRLELVSFANFRRHVKLNPKYQRRLKEAEETREEFLREFHIANIRQHAPRNVLASLWWLERRYPNQFALRNVYRSERAADQPIGDKIDEDQFRRYAALIQDFRPENEAKTAFQSPALITAAIGLDSETGARIQKSWRLEKSQRRYRRRDGGFQVSGYGDSGVTEAPQPTPTPVVQLPAPEKGKVYGFQDLMVRGRDLAGKVVQVEVLPKAEQKTDLHDGRYCITLYDPKRVFGFVYCTKGGLQKLGFEDGTATKNQLIYVLMKKD